MGERELSPTWMNSEEHGVSEEEDKEERRQARSE